MSWSAPGVWTYHATTGASTFVLNTSQVLLAARFFANAVDGTVQISPRTLTTGASTADSIVVRAGFGFDWTPAAKVVPVVIAVSASIDAFYEFSS